jgi:hypothetical protein
MLSVTSRREFLIAALIVLLFWTWVAFAPEAVSSYTKRVVADFYDRGVYFQRGTWLTQGTPALSEYPPIATLLFGLTHLVTPSVGGVEPTRVYAAVFSLLMTVPLLGVVALLMQHLQASRKKWAWLMLLPPALYFALNRFDILPALFCLLGFLALLKMQSARAGLWMAIGAFTKWYPALLMPAFVIHAWRKTGRFPWRMVMTFALVSAAINAAVFAHGGRDALLAPYQAHVSRIAEMVSLPVLIDAGAQALGLWRGQPPMLLTVLSLFQFLPAIMTAFVRLDSEEALTDQALVSIGAFVFFSRVWSPQWLLWILPFAILAIRNRSDAVLNATYCGLMYVCFPFLFDLFGVTDARLRVGASIAYFVLAIILMRATIRLLGQRRGSLSAIRT